MPYNRSGRSLRGGIGGAAPPRMPSFSPRKYANGGLADVMAGAAGPAMPDQMQPPMPGGESGPSANPELERRVAEVVVALHAEGGEGESVIRDFVRDFGEEVLMMVIDQLSKITGDGMSDDIPARIDGEEEVRLSSGEYIVPADAVSGLGNGSTEAGAGELMDMVERIRGARGGSVEQPPAIDPAGIIPV